MMPTLTEVRSSVDAALIAYCREKQRLAAALDPSYERLWSTLTSVAAGGGKRLRPYIILLAYKACGGKDDIMAVATAWEMLHICLLVHDDIIDRDYVRHGQPNIAGHYLKTYQGSTNPEHYANSAALLGGDLALVGSHDLILRSNLGAQQKQTALEALNACVFAEAAGELIDTEAAMHPPESVDAEKVAYLKTARYSFIDPLALGARLAGAEAAELVKLEQFGRALGIGYQLTDDLLGMFGNPATTGKSVIGDLREGKRTMLLQETMAKAGKAEGKKLAALIGRSDVTEAEAAFVRSLAEANGAKQAIETQIAAHTTKSHEVLATLAIGQEYRAALQQLADMALRREQ